MRPRGECGQASVELLAGVPALLVAGLIALQLLAAGYSLTLADGAAEAGAMALAAGRPAGERLPDGAPRLGARPGGRRGPRRAADGAPAAALADRGARRTPRAPILGVGAEASGRMTARSPMRHTGNQVPRRCLLLATDLGEAKGGLAIAAAVAVTVAVDGPGRSSGVLLVELGSERARGPTML